MTTRPQGPWVKKLIIRFMTTAAVPDGGGVADAIKWLTTPGMMQSAARNATVLAFEAIDAVRSAPDCKWTTDEEIAEQIVTAIEDKVMVNRLDRG